MLRNAIEFGDDAMRMLISKASMLCNLTLLSLNYNPFTDEGVACFSEALHLFPNLTSIQFTGNAFGGAGMAKLFRALENFSSLEMLLLSQNSIADVHYDAAAAAITETLANFSRLKSLSLFDCGLKESLANSLFKLVVFSPHKFGSIQSCMVEKALHQAVGFARGSYDAHGSRDEATVADFSLKLVEFLRQHPLFYAAGISVVGERK